MNNSIVGTPWSETAFQVVLILNMALGYDGMIIPNTEQCLSQGTPDIPCLPYFNFLEPGLEMIPPL